MHRTGAPSIHYTLNTHRLGPRSSTPGSLSNYNQELVRCIEDLREKREEVNRSILRDEEEKAKIQRELTKMTERLGKLNEDLARKMQVSGHWRECSHLHEARELTDHSRTRTSHLARAQQQHPARRAWSLTRPFRRRRRRT